jgi:Ion channel
MGPWSNTGPGRRGHRIPRGGTCHLVKADSRQMSNSALLIAMLLLLVVEPFFSLRSFGRVAFDMMVAVVLIAAIWAVSQHRRLLGIGLLLAAPLFLARLVLYVVDIHWLAVLWPLLAIAFFAFTAAVLLRQVLYDATVTVDTIAGSISVYLLLGVIWALIFSLVEAVHPGSFHVNGSPFEASGSVYHSQVPEFLYLSLITISTVGYGDIVPVTQPARMLAALEGVIGQLYLAVLIARLIGLHKPRASHDA